MGLRGREHRSGWWASSTGDGGGWSSKGGVECNGKGEVGGSGVTDIFLRGQAEH